MNIDKNLIKYWSYLCENKDEAYDFIELPNDNPKQEYIQFQDAIEQVTSHEIISDILQNFDTAISHEGIIYKRDFDDIDFDNMDIEFGGMSMIQKHEQDYYITKHCEEVFSNKDRVYGFVNSEKLNLGLINSLANQLKNKIKIIKSKKEFQKLNCQVEIKPGKYEAYADNIHFGRVTNGTFKITIEFNKPSKMNLNLYRYPGEDDKYSIDSYLVGGNSKGGVNLTAQANLNRSKPLIPKESKEPNYDDFIPGDKSLTDDELKKQISLLDWLSKEFKKNPDEGIKLLTRNKKLLGVTFEMWSYSMKQLMARNKKEN